MRILLVLILIAFSSLSFAAQIAVIDAKKMMSESNYGKKLTQQLLDKQDKYSKELQGLRAELEQLTSKYKAQAKLMSDDKRTDLENQITTKTQTFQSKTQAYSEEMAKSQEQATQTILDASVNIISAYAKKNNIDLVVNSQVGILMYSDPKLDITDSIMNELNKAYK